MQPQAILVPSRDFSGGRHHASPVFGQDYIGEQTLDYCGAVLALVLFAIPMVVIALALKLFGPGPAIFSQTRFGRDGQPFAVYKFRTMHPAWACDGKGPVVSRLGGFLRRTSLDELPQLFNVLRGEMSLVGPRPHMIDMRVDGALYDQLIDNYHIRHTVRPGITGWAQINGCRGFVRSIRSAQDRVNLDLDYIHRRTMWLDIVILALTLKNEFLSGNGS